MTNYLYILPLVRDMSWQQLSELGLNDNQSKVLYNLMLLNEGKASEIAEAAGISRVRVYDILKELYSMGLIRKIEARPTRYKALAPEKTIDKYLKWKEERYQQEKRQLQSLKGSLTETLQAAFQRKEEERPDNLLELLPLGDVSERETKDIIKEGKEIKIISESLSYIDAIKDVLDRKNVRVQVILKRKQLLDNRGQKAHDKAVKILEDIGAAIKQAEELPLRGTITDQEAVLNVKDKQSSNLLRDCIYTNHDSFVQAMNLYFNQQWQQLEKLEI